MLRNIFPFFCVGCQVALEKFGLCQVCHSALPYRQVYCQHCGQPLAQSAENCGHCQTVPDYIQNIFSVFHHEPPISTWLHAFKYQGDLAYGRLLAELLAATAAPRRPSAAIVPVPLHRRRLAERGFNQSLELARPLAKIWTKPLLRFAVQRRKATQSQVGLSSRERQANVREAFSSASLPYEHILLIDDVFTTGSTLFSLAKTIHAAAPGCRIRLLTLCRQD
jgi:ComF family protein